eukprot:scaffold5178_cov141-Skeletonema_menzelii.AAC.5
MSERVFHMQFIVVTVLKVTPMYKLKFLSESTEIGLKKRKSPKNHSWPTIMELHAPRPLALANDPHGTSRTPFKK